MKKLNVNVANLLFNDYHRKYEHNMKLKRCSAMCDGDIMNTVLMMLDYDNICVAGGAAVCSIIGEEIKDIDIFLIVSRNFSEEKRKQIALDKIEEIINICCQVGILGDTTRLIKRTANVVSILMMKENVADSQMFEIQIILRLYDSVNEVLAGFDIDSCCFAYNGKDYLTTNRGLFTLQHGINCVDLTRRSPTYEMRLIKYARRGFSIYVPGFSRRGALLTKSTGEKIIGLKYLIDREQNRYHGKQMDYWKGERWTNLGVRSDYDMNPINEWKISNDDIDDDGFRLTCHPNTKLRIYSRKDNMYIDISSDHIEKYHSDQYYIAAIYFGTSSKASNGFRIPKKYKSYFKFGPEIEFMMDNAGSQLTSSYTKEILKDQRLWYNV
jgi:hypothetical protein